MLLLAAAQLFYAACNVSDPTQNGFSLTPPSVTFASQCVTFGGDLNAPLKLMPCASPPDASQSFTFANNAFSNPNIQWSGQEYSACSSTPPSLGVGCIIGAWQTALPTTWNNAFVPNSPAVGMIQALYTSGGGGHSPSDLCVSAVMPAPPAPPPIPSADVLNWSRREIMCLYDIDMCTYDEAQLQGCNCAAPPPPVNTWAPTALDTDSWIEAGMAAGCEVHILVAKHLCGFVSWPSRAGDELGYNYSTAHSVGSGAVDVVGHFVASARSAQQRIGMYYSLTNNARTNTCAGQVLPNPATPNQINVSPAQYDDIVKAHVTELWSNYGVLDEIWFDGGFSATQREWLPPLIAALQPHAVYFNGGGLGPNPTRWIGSESGYAPNDTWSTCDLSVASGAGNPDSPTWFPAETDFTVLQHDTWCFDTLHPVRPPSQLRDMYEQSVGHNSQALIGVGIPPNATLKGTAQADAMAQLGAYVRACYGSPIASTSGTALVLTVMPSNPVAIDRIIVSEDQTTGQRIREWSLTARLSDGSQVALATGQSIGNKRIVVIPPTTVSMVVFNASVAIGVPVIRDFSIYSCDGLI